MSSTTTDNADATHVNEPRDEHTQDVQVTIPATATPPPLPNHNNDDQQMASHQKIIENLLVNMEWISKQQEEQLRIPTLRKIQDMDLVANFAAALSKSIEEAKEELNIVENQYRESDLRMTTNAIMRNLKHILRILFPSPKVYKYSLETPMSFFKKLLSIPLRPPHLYDSTAFSVWSSIWIFLGVFASIAVVGALSNYGFDPTGRPLFYAAYGATATLLFGLPYVDAAQPRNIFWGTILSSFIGCSVGQLFANNGSLRWLAAALSVSSAITVMNLTGTLHPPGGALSLLYVVSADTQRARWWYTLFALLGQTILFIVAVIANNVQKEKRYPRYWSIL